MNPRRLIWAVSGPAAVAAWLVAARLIEPDGISWCPIRRLIGLPCPGCGMSRALVALGRGEWARAIDLHPLAPVLVLEVFLLWLLWGLVAAGRRSWPPRTVLLTWLGLNGAALAALWLWRLAAGTLPW
ncbi:MAG TPA: DUF2752 domain-containing protein [Methylomirabilota bacterium]